jgi:hypothetical protein
MTDISLEDLDGYTPAEIRGLTRAGKLAHLLDPPEAEPEAVEPEAEPEAKPVPVDMGARGGP